MFPEGYFLGESTLWATKHVSPKARERPVRLVPASRMSTPRNKQRAIRQKKIGCLSETPSRMSTAVRNQGLRSGLTPPSSWRNSTSCSVRNREQGRANQDLAEGVCALRLKPNARPPNDSFRQEHAVLHIGFPTPYRVSNTDSPYCAADVIKEGWPPPTC